MKHWLVQARAGRLDEAMSEARRLIERATEVRKLKGGFTSVQLYLHAAAALGIVSQQAPEADRMQLLDEAIEAMRQAINAGFNNSEYLRTDPDLSPLKESPKYESLLPQVARCTPHLSSDPHELASWDRKKRRCGIQRAHAGGVHRLNPSKQVLCKLHSLFTGGSGSNALGGYFSEPSPK